MNESPSTTEAPREQEPLDADDSWLERAEELPARPRRRILAPLPVALLLALTLACGFIAGVLVQKGQGGSSGSGASGFSALRGASAFGGAGAAAAPGGGTSSPTGSPTSATPGSTSTSGSVSSPLGGPGAGGASGASGGAGARSANGATIGQVAYVSKGTLYVTTTEGNTVKVTAAPGSKVTKTVETHVKGIHPGETVLVSGTTNANGSISASSIRAGEAGGFGGAALFGAGAGGGSGAPSAGGSSSAATGAGGKGSSGGSTGGPALFGKE